MKFINYKILFFLIIFIYCAFTARYGFENWDTGYIPSFSWRIVNGQSVYEDFFYKGPPLTLYFHAFFMKFLPVNGQFYFIRIIIYILFSLQVYFTVSGFYNFFGHKIKYDKWVLICIGFIISLLNFPPYPWPTTDGLLFASIAFYLVSASNKLGLLKILLISLFCILSALTKQSFYFIPLIFTIWISILYNFKKGIYFIISSIIWISIFLIWISSITSISNFIGQITGETNLKGLIYAGIIDYIRIEPGKYYIYFSIIVIFLIYVYKTRKNKFPLSHLLLKSLPAIIFSFAFFLYFIKEFLIASRLEMIACFLVLVYKIMFPFKTENIKIYSPLMILLSIAWCCSISMGYPYPILFSTGIILSALILFDEVFQILNAYKKTFALVTIVLCSVAYSYNLRPYRENYISQINYSLDSVSPKLRYIKTNKTNYEKLFELKLLVQKYGPNYIVAPNIPITHYLFNTTSALPADWIINSEINRNPELFISLASESKNYIFLEKSFVNGEELMPEKKEDFSLVAWYIYKKFNKVGETRHFIIYNSLVQK